MGGASWNKSRAAQTTKAEVSTPEGKGSASLDNSTPKKSRLGFNLLQPGAMSFKRTPKKSDGQAEAKAGAKAKGSADGKAGLKGRFKFKVPKLVWTEHSISGEVEVGAHAGVSTSVEAGGEVSTAAQGKKTVSSEPIVFKPNEELGELATQLSQEMRELLKEGNAQARDIASILRKLYSTADADGSSYLDRVEIVEVMRAYYKLEGIDRSRTKVNQELDAVMDKYDTSKDGMLNFMEFVAMFCDTSSDSVMKLKISDQLKEETFVFCSEFLQIAEF